MLKAVIFDFDGVIVDSEPLHFRTFHETLMPHGFNLTWEEYKDVYIGLDDRGAFTHALAAMGLPTDATAVRALIEEKSKRFAEVLDGHDLQPYPGVAELLRALHGRHPVGLCSGALRSDIFPILEELHLKDCFNVFVTTDDVHASKPDPTSYRLCAQRLAENFPGAGITAAECVAIEDTPDGLVAALGAGMRTIAVTTNFPAEYLANAHRVVNSLAELSVAALETFAGGPPPA